MKLPEILRRNIKRKEFFYSLFIIWITKHIKVIFVFYQRIRYEKFTGTKFAYQEVG